MCGEPLSAVSVDPTTGVITWVDCPKPDRNGTRAGWKSHNGYRIIEIHGKRYRAHHIIWFIATGQWPKDEIDHINGDRDDNRISNLREATVSQNRTNRRNSTHNTSGYKWVHWDSQYDKWMAEVNYRDESGAPKKYRTRHETPEAAFDAAKAFAASAHGQWFNPGS